MITVKKRIKRLKRKTYRRKGGSAIDAGTYGCVFNPAIKCVKSNSSANTISKLMFDKKAQIELVEIDKIKKIVKDIPGNENYFLLTNIHHCKPDQLTTEDLTNFDEKCTLFTKRNINSRNINSNLEKLSLIVMPNGGISINKFIKNIIQMPAQEMNKKFVACNNSLVKLLINGIVPMNAKKFNHYDIKKDNILLGDDGHARLIDWGLADSNDGVNIPRAIINHPIVFNLPFSCILFNSFVKKMLSHELRKIKSSNQKFKIVATTLLNESLQNIGHYNYITTKILPLIFDSNLVSQNVLIDYIEAVLLVFVDKKGNFNDTKYFYKVFAKNADIWGFLTSYLPIIDHGKGKFKPALINSIRRILLKYCFSTEFATKPINVNEVARELKLLNMI
jgi:hypothetical protein